MIGLHSTNARRFNNIDDKAYFAVYSNMARMNAFVILKEIQDSGVEEDTLATNHPLCKLNLFDVGKSSDIERLYQKMAMHLPFLRDITVEEFTNTQFSVSNLNLLGSLLKVLHEIRNYTSHYWSDTSELNEHNKEVGAILDLLFERAKLRLKEEPYHFREDDLTHLSNSEIYTWIDKGGNLSEKAVAFILCLFLRGREANDFIRKLTGFKRSSESWAKASVVAFTLYGCKLPKPAFISQNTHDSILLDALTELTRCPREVYAILKDEVKEKFQHSVIPSKEDEMEGVEERHLVTAIRHEDRFPYFALRYMDILGGFSKLKFMIVVGKQYEYFRDRGSIEQVVRHRNINGFARLDTLINNTAKQKAWMDNPDAKQFRYKEIHSYNPQYFIKNGNIGIQFTTKDVLPSIKRKKIDDNNLESITIETQKPDIWMSIYEIRNMAFLLHLLKVQNLSSEIIENAIQDFIESQRRFLNDMRNGVFNEMTKSESLLTGIQTRYGLKPASLTDVMKKHLRGGKVTSYKERALNSVRAMLKDTQERLNVLLNDAKSSEQFRRKWSKNTDDKPPFPKQPRTGQKAAYLVNDIQDLLPFNKKLTLSQYRQLQQSFALYKTKNPVDFINSLSISPKGVEYDKSGKKLPYHSEGHPFLYDDVELAGNDIDRFYFEYLHSKEGWLLYTEKYISDLEEKEIINHHQLFQYLKLGIALQESSTGQVKKIYFLKYDDAHFRELANRYSNLPVQMPRGFFNELIIKYLPESIKSTLAGSAKSINPIKALEAFLKSDAPHYYNPVNIKADSINEVKEKIQRIQQKKADDEVFKKSKTSKSTMVNQLKEKLDKTYAREQKIRYVLSCDRMLWLIIKDFLRSKQELSINIGSTTMMRDKIKGIMQEPIDVSYNIEYRDDLAMNNKKVYHVQTTLPLRRYGDLQKYKRDKRFSGIIHYLALKTNSSQVRIDLNQIEDAFYIYETERRRLISSILEFEKFVLSKMRVDSQKKLYKHKEILKEAITSGLISNNDAYIMDQNRNKALHNQVPVRANAAIEAEWNLDTIVGDSLFVEKLYFNSGIELYETKIK
ncbi:MAG: type VI-B CRISPR-associated RNA-guided ribonuclease Cas13b [Bacteroidetes bacterium]|nr:type VI-B CRISPR-associated RNA-guided ribonuclease Cas13b [Bacteroidota bacterium]